MKNFKISIIVVLFFLSSVVSYSQSTKDIENNGNKTNNEFLNMFGLQSAPKVSEQNQLVNFLSYLIDNNNTFKYKDNVLKGHYDIVWEQNKVTIRIFANSVNSKLKENSISEIILDRKNAEGNSSLAFSETNANFQSLLPTTDIRNSSTESLMYSNRIVIDKEILNFGEAGNYGKIFNRNVSRAYLRTPSNNPSSLFGDITDGLILPHFYNPSNGQIMITDMDWHRVITFDKDLADGFDAVGGDGSDCSPWKFYTPTGIDNGDYITTYSGCYTYKTYPVYISDLSCQKIIAFDYRIGDCPSNHEHHLAPPENWRTIKSNLDNPYDIAYHTGEFNNQLSDDVLWYSEFKQALVCINPNNGQELQRITSLYYNGSLFNIKPTRFSIYRSPDGSRNIMVVIDANTNTAFYLKLNKYGKIASLPVAAFSAFGYVSNTVQSVLITSYNNGLDGATVWGVANDVNGNGLITTSTLKFLSNSYPVAEHLGYSSIGRNSDASFKNISNLHSQNGFLDLFTMERWDDSKGIRRYKPGLDVQAISASDYCVDYRYMTYKVTLTNPAHVQLSAEWKNVTAPNWSNCFVSVDGVIECTNFYLPAGTSTLIIRTNQFNTASTSSGDNLLRINCTYSPQDEDFNSPNKLVRGYQVSVNNHCGGVNGGCPYLFTYNGNEFIAENNLLHKSELSENIGVNITDKYLLKVKPVLNEDKKFEFKIREAEDDHNIYDYVSLVAVDHPLGSRVGITEENDIVLYYDNSAYSPTNAEKNLSIDITKDVQYDTNDHKTVDGDPGDGIFGVFGDIEEGKSNLLRGRGIQQKYAVLMEVDALIRPITPGVKDYAGFITGYSNADAVIFPTQLFAERENPYINIIPFSEDIWVDSATIDWNRDYSLNYLASLPIYYGGYETSECELFSAVDSNSGDITGKLYYDDESTIEYDNNSHLTLNFNESTTLLQTGYTRSYVFVIKGQYYQNAQYRNSQVNANVNKVTELSQNYPNPFNPKTTIKFMLNLDSRVKIEIYDVLGKRIALLVDDFLQTGVHDVTFDGSNFASGIYFYKMTTDNFTSIKKMTLVK